LDVRGKRDRPPEGFLRKLVEYAATRHDADEWLTAFHDNNREARANDILEQCEAVRLKVRYGYLLQCSLLLHGHIVDHLPVARNTALICRGALRKEGPNGPSEVGSRESDSALGYRTVAPWQGSWGDFPGSRGRRTTKREAQYPNIRVNVRDV